MVSVENSLHLFRGRESLESNVILVNLQEAKTHLSRYLKAVENGEVVVLCRHNKPIAELRAIANPEPKRVPQFGLWEGFGVSESFFEPLPDDMLKAFSDE
jgi:antitoxin (DNA-binding transcriptional repressor) of toxin-antitoxin stability system